MNTFKVSPCLLKLQDRLVQTELREKAGATASARFDFQKDWSLMKLLDTHLSGLDYVVVFDFHDDLLIIDSESNPNKVTFYQIKGKKSGNWTLAGLLKSETSKKNGTPLLSIIGKLYDCKSKFELETVSLNFISNQRYSITHKDGSSCLELDSVLLSDLKKEDQYKIIKQIKEEHKISTCLPFEGITSLQVTELSLGESATHVKGKISEFLESEFPKKTFNVPSVYRMLFDEIRRRAGYDKAINNYGELITRKGIAKSQLNAIIQATGLNKDYKDIWNRASTDLTSNGISLQQRNKLYEGWLALEIARMQPDDKLLFSLINAIKIIVKREEVTAAYSSFNLLGALNHLTGAVRSELTIPVTYDEHFVKAIILSEVYE